MRPALLLVLCAGLTVGCSSTRSDRSSRAYPASARVESRSGPDRYVLCHKGKNTRTLPESAVRAHLNHGDRFGSCRSARRDTSRRGERGRGNRQRQRHG